MTKKARHIQEWPEAWSGPPQSPFSQPAWCTKRGLDLVISVVGLVIMSPVIAITALVIYARLGRPVVFCQTRAGKDGVPFQIYKFRTMRHAVDQDGRLLPDEQRLTPLGHFLRRWSLDELPQLVNVLRGELSLIGPRPQIMEYMLLLTIEQARRHEVRPGITGLAQVNGRNSITWEERFIYDVWYIDHWSLWLDLKILWRTVFYVLAAKGISSAGIATMPPFTGSLASTPTARRPDLGLLTIRESHRSSAIKCWAPACEHRRARDPSGWASGGRCQRNGSTAHDEDE